MEINLFEKNLWDTAFGMINSYFLVDFNFDIDFWAKVFTVDNEQKEKCTEHNCC